MPLTLLQILLLRKLNSLAHLTNVMSKRLLDVSRDSVQRLVRHVARTETRVR